MLAHSGDTLSGTPWTLPSDSEIFFTVSTVVAHTRAILGVVACTGIGLHLVELTGEVGEPLIHGAW